MGLGAGASRYCPLGNILDDRIRLVDLVGNGSIFWSVGRAV